MEALRGFLSMCLLKPPDQILQKDGAHSDQSVLLPRSKGNYKYHHTELMRDESPNIQHVDLHEEATENTKLATTSNTEIWQTHTQHDKKDHGC